MARPTSKRYGTLTLLGRSEAVPPEQPENARLETFPNPRPKRSYHIRIECPDFTSLCPVTGQPDFARIVVEYIPRELCLETKALKFYLASFRNVGAFNEDVINRILDALVKACRPRWIRIEGRFAARGGLALSVFAEHPDSSRNPRPPVRRKR